MVDSAFPSPLAQGFPCSFAVHHVQPSRVWIDEVVSAFGGGGGSEGGGGGGGGGGCCTGGLEGCCVGAFCVLEDEFVGLVCVPTLEVELALAGAPPQPVREMRTLVATTISAETLRCCARESTYKKAGRISFIKDNSNFVGDRTERVAYVLLTIWLTDADYR
jgi:hypothetical protein